MKVVHITTASTGGAGIAAYRIHQGFTDYKSDIITSSFIQKYPVKDKDKDIYQCTHFHNLYYRIVNKLGLIPYLTKEGRFRNTISKYPKNYEIVTLPFSYYPIEKHPLVKDADIIHLHWTGDFLNYPTFFKNIKQPIVWTLHDMNPFQGIFHYEEDIERNKSSLLKLEEKIKEDKMKYMHKKDNIFIVSPSEWLKLRSEKSRLLSKYPHFLIPYGFNPDLYPQLNKNEMKIRLGISNEKYNILFIAYGLNIYRKGVDLLIKALESLDVSKFNLISVGGNLNLPMPKGINYIELGRINDITELNKIYSAVDLTILPSREDNMPNVMVESLLNGTPVVCFQNGGMAEYILTGKNGIVINDISANALKTAIHDYYNNKYQLFSREIIRQYPITSLNSKLQAERYINLYQDILSK